MLPLRTLHSITTVTLLLSLSFFCFRLTSAVCCTSKDNGYCYDNNRMKGYCCGHGSCNLFCCACSGGCLGSLLLPTPPRGGGLADLYDRALNIDGESNASNSAHGNNVIISRYAVCHASTGSTIFSGDEDCGSQLFHLLDTEGVGKISLAQYLGWHASRGDAADVDIDDEFIFGAAEYFYRFDANKDGFVDETEMRRAVV